MPNVYSVFSLQYFFVWRFCHGKDKSDQGKLIIGVKVQYCLSNAVTSGGILRHQHSRGERGAGPHRAVRERGAQDLREHCAAGRQTGGKGLILVPQID